LLADGVAAAAAAAARYQHARGGGKIAQCVRSAHTLLLLLRALPKRAPPAASTLCQPKHLLL
jgi:hypothetical protein